MNKSFFKKYSLFTLCFTLGVILWGAWVRLSHSGDGCGSDWPLCKGALIPQEQSALIEWIHRLTSGLSFLFILGLFILAFNIYPKKHLVRRLSVYALFFVSVEALIGAILVLASLTESNPSSLRLGVFLFHLINSLLLVKALTLCWKGTYFDKFKWKKPAVYFLIAFPCLILTGGIASLAGTLFPSQSLSEAFLLDWLPSSHITLKLRPLHPLLAGIFIIFFGFFMKPIRIYRRLFYCFIFAFLFGLATLLSLSPLVMKLTHLLIAYLLAVFLIQQSTYFISQNKEIK